ncbi:uncharacterized protein LOC134259502 [Saccostrea cucullata]|uniref:uncharacterized protein LOC134259502 n=1 Tax=Saccostrea cuccullata TaxID=36930 RepID=UPI002ED1277F
MIFRFFGEVFMVLVTSCYGREIRASLSQSTSPWSSAKTQCAPLGSQTSFNVSNDSIVLSNRSATDGVFWIGAYVEHTKWIKILGCHYVGLIVSSPIQNSRVLETHDVKSCHDYCKGATVFGLGSNSCYCYGGNFSLSQITKCVPQKCSGSQNDFCGVDYNVVVYQIVSSQYQGLGECLASGYNGEYNTTGAQYFWFGQPVVLPCDNSELGYTYRTALNFPRSHHLFVYTLPVESWQDAVLRSYQTAQGLLEFPTFLIPKQSLASPMADDKYWVGLFRRHKMVFGLDIPNISITNCVGGKLNADGKLTTEIRSCDDSLRVLCEFSDRNDVTPAALTSVTPMVQPKMLSSTAKPENGSTEANNIFNSGTDFTDNLKWYLVLGGLVAVFLLVVVCTIVWAILKIKRRKTTNIPESTQNNYTDFRVVLQNRTGDKTTAGEDLYFTIPEQEMNPDAMVDRPRLSLPQRNYVNTESNAKEETPVSDEDNEMENEYTDITEEIDEEIFPIKSNSVSMSKRNVGQDAQYFVLEKADSTELQPSFKFKKSENNAGDLYDQVEGIDTNLYHELEKQVTVENVSSNLNNESKKPDVINNIYHVLEKPVSFEGANAQDRNKSVSRKSCKKNVSFFRKTETSSDKSYEKIWKESAKPSKVKSLKIKSRQGTSQDRTHAKVKVSASSPVVKAAVRKSRESSKKVSRNKVRVSGLPDVLASSNDSMYDMLKTSIKTSGAPRQNACDEDYDTMESVRAFLDQPSTGGK